jgi:Tfp pilus assembly protein PilZ
MESKFFVTSIGIGGAFFVGIVIFWFVFGYLKKRISADKLNQGYSAASKNIWEEKRQHPRVELSWPAFIEKAEQSQEVHVKDISLGGAFVICQQPLALQDQFRIIVDLPDHGAVPFNAEVVWSNANMPRKKVVNRGMGIRFMKNEQKERQLLQDAITAALEKTDESIEGKCTD